MKKILSIVLTLMIISQPVFAQPDLEAALQDTAEYIYTAVTEPQLGSTGGEWSVIGLARSGYEVPQQYYDDYYSRVAQFVKDCSGVLHNRKYTESSRVIVALTAIGKDPANVAGYNLLTPLGDYDKTILQGINGPIWALIALDCGGYDMPVNPDAKTQATRDMYIDCILSRQLADGGFALRGTAADVKADADVTGMALQALSSYQHRTDVKEAIDKALNCLSNMQGENGGFESWGAENCESCVQAIVALGELGIPLDDPRFVKNGNTLLDNLMTYYISGQGFMHTKTGDGSNLMASEQGLYALAAAKRLANGEESLYNIKDNHPEPKADAKETLNRIMQVIYALIQGV